MSVKASKNLISGQEHTSYRDNQPFILMFLAFSNDEEFHRSISGMSAHREPISGLVEAAPVM